MIRTAILCSPMFRRALALVVVAGLSGCNDKPATPVEPSASAVAVAPSAPPAAPTEAPVAVPVPRAEVEKVVNPKGDKPYEGKTGTLKGTITVKGDPPPPTEHKYAKECLAAIPAYEKLFRVGPNGALPDALVTVTGYDGFVPEPDPAQSVQIENCTFDASTIALTFGQRLEVKNLDPKLSFMPYLDGAPFRAVMVAIPQGEAVKLYPQREGRYLLRDQMRRPYLIANVFVLKFPTHDVTDREGRYEISGIPVGKVTTSALLPVVRKVVNKEIEIKEGDNVLDLVIEYDAKKDKPMPIPEPVWGDRALPK